MKIIDSFFSNMTSIIDDKNCDEISKGKINFEKELSKIKEKKVSTKSNLNNNTIKKYNVKNDYSNNGINFKEENKDIVKEDNNHIKEKPVKKESFNNYFEGDISKLEDVDEPNLEIFEENILYNIVLISKVSKEDINNILNDLDISVNDFANKAKLNLFLGKLFNTDNPIELLSIPEAADIIKNIDLFNEKMLDISEDNNKLSFLSDLEKESIEIKKINNNEKNNFIKYNNLEESELLLNNDVDVDINYFSDRKNGEESNVTYKNESQTDQLEINKLDSSDNIDNFSDKFFPATSGEINDIKMKTMNTSTIGEKIKNINAKDVINQISNKIKSSFKLEGSELNIKLRPEELGDITLKISTENGIVIAKFIAENQKIKEIIESRFNDLKNILNKQGVNISELSVSVDRESKNDSMQEFFKEKEKSKLRVSKIINNIIDESDEGETNSMKSIDVYKNNVDYTA